MGLELLSRLQTPFQPAAGGSPAHPSPAAEGTAHELFEGLPPPPPQLYLPTPPQIPASVAQTVSCQAVPKSLPGSLDMLPLCFGRKAAISSGPRGGRSCLCQLPAVCRLSRLALGVPGDPLHLQSVPYQAAATGTLWRHRQQTPGSGGPGAALSSALQFCGQAGYHVYLSQQGNYFPHDSSYMLQALSCTEKGLSHLVRAPSVLGTWEGFSWVNTLLAMQGRPHHEPLVTGGKPKLHRYYF